MGLGAAWSVVDEFAARPPKAAGTVVTDYGQFGVRIADYLYEQKYLWGDFAAAAVLSGLPITLVFLAAQRWIVSGLTAGGVKG